MDAIQHCLTVINQYIWGIPALIILCGTGLYLTFKLRFIQLREFKKALTLVFHKSDHPGEISRFQALSTALSGAVGTGNIAGVATAITMGGPGAIFWMWVSAVVGMATKFTSTTLAVKYREKDPYDIYAGGPMYTLKNGLNMPKLGAVFAILTIISSFGTGNTIQVNSIVNGLQYIMPSTSDHSLFMGFLIAVAVGVVVIGGVKRIASVASFVVPFMAAAYCFAALIIIAINYKAVPHAFAEIFNLALNPRAAGAGALGMALRYGIARGVLSNEAGLGSTPIAHAAAKTEHPEDQGYVAMLEPFIDTLLICTLTALVIIIAGTGAPNGLTGAALSSYAFENGLGGLIQDHGLFGAWVVGLGLVFFAYTTIIAWSYYGDRCVQYLLGHRFVMFYRVIFISAIMFGAVAPLPLVWEFADFANLMMAIPNIISLLLLANVAVKATHPR